MVQFLILDGPLSGQVATHHETFRSSGELQTTHKKAQVTHIFLQVVYFYSTTVSIPRYYFLTLRISKNCNCVQATIFNLPFPTYHFYWPIRMQLLFTFICLFGSVAI